MIALLSWAASNVAVAAVLAAAAFAAGRWSRRPALTHGLWILVFLKLLTPPLVSIPVFQTNQGSDAPAAEAVLRPAPVHELAPQPEARRAALLPQLDQIVPRQEEPQATPESAPARPKALPLVVVMPQPERPFKAEAEPPAEPRRLAPAAVFSWSWLATALGWIWLAGAFAWSILAVTRLLRFHRLLSLGEPASAELRHLAKDVAGRMRVRCPRLVVVPGVVSPMLWVFGWRPRLVLPATLIERLPSSQWRPLLAHELAHWRRRDHWVRWLELVVMGIYWWCPLVWWAKRQLQQAEEECCDAWVVTTFPAAARDYALALVETVDFLSGARAILPPAASGLGHVHFLRRRLTMILRGRTPRALTLTGLLVVAALGLGLLPLAPTWAQATSPAAVNVQKDDGDKKEPVGEKADPDKARQDFQKLQEDLFKLQQQMDQKRREFEEKLAKEFGEKQQDLVKRMNEAMKKAGFPGVGGLGGLAAPPVPLQPGFAPQLVPLQPGVGFPNPGGLQPAGPLGGIGPRGSDLERRLEELEKKIDRLMQKIGGDAPKNTPNRTPGGGGATPPEGEASAAPQAGPASRSAAPAVRTKNDR